MLQVIAASMLAHGPQDIAVGEEDVLVCPQVSSRISFMDWSRHSELFSDAYDRTTRWIEERLCQDDPALRAVLGTARPSAELKRGLNCHKRKVTEATISGARTEHRRARVGTHREGIGAKHVGVEMPIVFQVRSPVWIRMCPKSRGTPVSQTLQPCDEGWGPRLLLRSGIRRAGNNDPCPVTHTSCEAKSGCISHRRHLVEFRQGWIDVVPSVTAHAVRHHLRLVSAHGIGSWVSRSAGG